MAAEKFHISFKKQPRETGLRAVAYPYPATDIKVNKKVVGYISHTSWQEKENGWYVRLAVKKEPTTASPAPFKWAHTKKYFTSEPEAREWVVAHLFSTSQQYPLHFFED